MKGPSRVKFLLLKYEVGWWNWCTFSWLLVAMGFNRVGISGWLLVAVGLSVAQWDKLRAVQVPARSQLDDSGQPLLQVNTGVSSQNVPSDSQTVSRVVVPLGLQLQIPSGVDAQQVLQRPVKTITWRFPATPQIPTPPAPVYVERQSDPLPVQGVTVQCTESELYVEVRKDLFSSDASLNTADLSLGGCAAKGMDASSQALIFESALHGCNSMLTVTASELVYIFTLGIASVPSGGSPIQRKAGIKVSIECHYPRHHNVSSSALMPAWIPYSSSQAAKELLVYSMRLMMDDWMSERRSNQYYLGEVINIEVSVLQFKHMPLRVSVDRCVATTVPETNSVPRYSFIENHGCLVDSKLTHSSSRFMPQTQADKLRFQLEAFKFQQGHSSLVYIACILTASAASSPADPEHKACSFSDYRWTAAYGADQVCSCCSGSCASRLGHDPLAEQGLDLERKVSLGPIVVGLN